MSDPMNTPPNEERLLAWIEGEMSPEEAKAFEAEIADDESLQVFLRGARSDRAQLQFWGRSAALSAPDDLLTEVYARAERRALSETFGGAANETDDVVATIGRRPLFSGWRVGIAAMFLLAASAGVTVTALRSTTPASRPAPVASADDDQTEHEPVASMADAGDAAEETPEPGAQIAMRSADESLDARPVVSDGSRGMGALQGRRSADGGSAGESARTTAPTLTDEDRDEALRLLGEGRLLIVASLREDRPQVFSLHQVVAATGDSVAWTDVEGRRLFASAGGVLAWNGVGAPAPGPAAEGEPALEAPEELRITMHRSPEAVNAFLDVLVEHCVTLEVRPALEALPIPAPSNPDDVLWWNASATHWSGLGAGRVLLERE